MRKVSELPSGNPIKYFYCPLCKVPYENDTDRQRAFCFQHEWVSEMERYTDRESLDKRLARIAQLSIDINTKE